MNPLDKFTVLSQSRSDAVWASRKCSVDAIKLALDQLKDDGGDQLLQQVMQEVRLGTMSPVVSPITSPANAPTLSDFEVETAARDLELEMEKMDQSANR